MVYLLSALAAIAASETVLRLSLRNTANATLTAARKSLAVIRSPRISEHWKERVLLRYSQELLLGSLKNRLERGCRGSDRLFLFLARLPA